MSEDYRIVEVRGEPLPAGGATNQTCTEEQNSSANVAPEEADAIAHQIALEPAGERDQVTPSGWFG